MYRGRINRRRLSSTTFQLPSVSAGRPTFAAAPPAARLLWKEKKPRKEPSSSSSSCLLLLPLRTTSVRGGGDRRMLLLALLCLFAGAKFVLCAPEECAHKVGIEGGDIVLSSGIVTEGNLDEISFKKEGNKVAEWDPYLNYTYYSSMVNRSEIDIHSGHLTIRNLSQNDTGNYMVEVTIAGKIKVTCFVLEVLVPLEPPDLHCEVVSGTIKVNCTPTIQDLRLKYDWHYVKMEEIEHPDQLVIQRNNTNLSRNITCVITLNKLNASNFISLSTCVSKDSANSGNRARTITLVLFILFVGCAIGVFIFYKKGYFKRCNTSAKPSDSSVDREVGNPLNAENSDETENSANTNRD
uniref:Immunoglobulin subtype domain-containing protein n=1 Tax=Salvator merianae TaxID=96440 RepID=A0A8D0DL77_SALMN